MMARDRSQLHSTTPTRTPTRTRTCSAQAGPIPIRNLCAWLVSS